MERLAKEKTNGEVPTMTYYAETDKLSVDVATGFPVIGSVTLEFDKAQCKDVLKNVEVVLPRHADL